MDIHKLNMEELTGVVGLYPWYAAARKELCKRMSQLGALSEAQIAQTALYIGSRRILADMVRSGRTVDCSDRDAAKLAGELISPAQTPRKQIFVGVGDYFSQSQYDGARRSDDAIFSRFAKESTLPADRGEDTGPAVDFCTETLAQIYLEQDYPEQAIEIYSKLSLRYPEKSVYFAALIDEINKKK